jgi:hypothetical protein
MEPEDHRDAALIEDGYQSELKQIQALIKHFQHQMQEQQIQEKNARARCNRMVCTFLERWRDRIGSCSDPKVRELCSEYLESADAKKQKVQLFERLLAQLGFYSTQADRELCSLAEEEAEEASEKWADLQDLVRMTIAKPFFGKF